LLPALLTLCAATITVGDTYAVRITVTSRLPCANVPMGPVIDFAALIREAGLPGVLDPNSVRVVDVTSGEDVPCALSEDFAHGDSGRVEWVIRDPSHRRFDVLFRTAATRPPLLPRERTPLIGTGDLPRYNAGVPRPIALPYPARLVDLTGDGRADLVGCWNYAYRAGDPWSGVVCYPRVGAEDRFEFGDMIRIRYVDSPGSRDFRDLGGVYMNVDFADLNRDGLVDFVYSANGDDQLRFFLNSGERDGGGMPIFVAAGSAPRQTDCWGPIRAVDLSGDGVMDFVIGSYFSGGMSATYLRNTNPEGWPVALAEPVMLDTGRDPCFYDVDGDGLLDAVSLAKASEDPPGFGEREDFPADADPGARAARVVWRRNLGGDPPTFGLPQALEGIYEWWISAVCAVQDGPRRGLLVQHDVYQRISFYPLPLPVSPLPQGEWKGVRSPSPARAESLAAPLILGDQAWPCVCDWNGDGVWDLLVGGGYGWPRILINEGTNDRPAFSEPQLILSEGKPIRIVRDEVLGGHHWHNMGYPYPVFVDWDGDGLPDLVLPNETNRIFWYKNIGTRKRPAFGPRQQIICDGYPDSAEKRAKSARLAADQTVPNNPYPYEEDEPFFWRTGAAFADWNGDGLMDFITLDGFTRKATLFSQYHAADGTLRLRKDRWLSLSDGRAIDDSIVARASHWTESFRAVDWDGDGLTDLIYNCAGTEDAKGSIYLLRNVFELPVTLCCFGTPIKVTAHGPNAWPADLDGDGQTDLLCCVEWSVYPFFSRAAIEMKERPKYRMGRVRAVRE
jgi:hypothetical protein